MGRRSLLPIFPIKTIYDDSVDRRRRRPAAPTVGAQTGVGRRNGEGAAAASTPKHVQAVLSACPRDTSVVTVIDTDRDWECYCPGD